ncbi:MAG: DUF1049 domain-containing protein [Persephonella sp.]|nr:MAG: DUF1049 domain-containing protein [Persephonella sp.]RUM60420.1 MAG: DUF1049 domain-containing protein [Persephonella sp.]
MLSKIRLIFWLIAILIIAYFVSINSEPRISITLFPNIKTQPLPLSLIIVGSLILGTILILIIAITDWIVFYIEKSKLKKKIKSLERDLNDLKNELERCSKDLEDCKNKDKSISEKPKINQNVNNQK